MAVVSSPGRRAAGGRPQAGLEGVEKSLPAPATARTRQSGTPACFAHVPHRRIANRAGYRSWPFVVLVVVAVAQRRLAPSSSATTSTTDRALPSSAVHAGGSPDRAVAVCDQPRRRTGIPSHGCPLRRSRSRHQLSGAALPRSSSHVAAASTPPAAAIGEAYWVSGSSSMV